jgi:hypothetical protein
MLPLSCLWLCDDHTAQELFCPDSFQQRYHSISYLSPIENRAVAAVLFTAIALSTLAFQSETSGAYIFNRCLGSGPVRRI